ncbi:hypothetical protein DMN91_004268 [Ooceraea biroi]|uniref:Uncharacterized protein n=1 Tax=Ooceraea biroi TaxID=2015173 RepID=A0A3L8DVT3_OOCBI|nr:hypothetical protein DMN91_004268 [Ooceraea biroi]
MSCLSQLDSQIATLLAVPHEILLLRHRVFREYAKIAVGTEFVHTLPSFLIVMAAVVILWRHPPSSTKLLDLGVTLIYKGFQVSVSWLIINAFLWLWLILQRILYCSVWHYWSYDVEYRIMSYPWWQRVWSSYYPARVQPLVMSADFISWSIAMTIAIITLGCAISADRVQAFVNESLLPKLRNVFAVVKSCTKWARNGTQGVVSLKEDSATNDEIGSVCDGRSEILTDANGAAQRDVHPISYGTNWVPQPNFSMFKEAQRNMSIKSFHTDPNKLTVKQSRYRAAVTP